MVLTEASVVNNFLFSQRTDTLSDEQKAATLRHNSYQLMMGSHLNKHFPFIPDFLESLPESISRPIMPPGLLDMLDLSDVCVALKSIGMVF